MIRTLVPCFLLGFIACTAVDYESPRFGERAADHEIVAVLPFEVTLTGKAPAGWTAQQIAKIEEGESLAFQMALYDSLLNRSDARRKRPIRIEIQTVERTRRLLQESGTGVRESWELPAESLAEILDVDAVVRSRVEKARYLSDLQSFGIDLGLEVLGQATGAVVPPGLAKTHDIWAESTLLNAEDGSLLWKVAVQREADWSRPANEVIFGVTRKLAKKFPYRSSAS